MTAYYVLPNQPPAIRLDNPTPEMVEHVEALGYARVDRSAWETHLRTWRER